MVVIGIDLGTTNCCLAIIKDDRVEILENTEGDRITPSIISFEDEEIVVGKEAKIMMGTGKKPENTIFAVKRLIGLKQNDSRFKQYSEKYPYNIIPKDEKVSICVQDQYYLPEEISAFFLSHLKKLTEKRLIDKVDKVVITVPTYFNDSQRQATINAGKIAGFESIHLLNEPTAAAINYGIENKITDDCIILVFDFGGGTFDVSVLKFSKNVYDVLAIDGDVNLGGEDIDNIIMDYFITTYNITNPRIRDICRLRAIAETAKISLSTKTKVESISTKKKKLIWS